MHCCCAPTSGLLRTLWQGVRIDAKMLALELAKETGPRGNYLAHRQPVSHCREQMWGSRYFGPNLPLSSDLRPDEDLIQRIDADLKILLSRRTVVPLEAAVAEVGAIRAGFAARWIA